MDKLFSQILLIALAGSFSCKTSRNSQLDDEGISYINQESVGPETCVPSAFIHSLAMNPKTKELLKYLGGESGADKTKDFIARYCSTKDKNQKNLRDIYSKEIGVFFAIWGGCGKRFFTRDQS